MIEPEDQREINKLRMQLSAARRIIRTQSIYVDDVQECEAALKRQGILTEYRDWINS